MIEWPPSNLVDLAPLKQQLADGGIDVSNGLGMTTQDDPKSVHTYDVYGEFMDLPPEAAPIVAAFFAPPATTKTTTSKSSSS